jgi:CheY-like chemotaxis protein
MSSILLVEDNPMNRVLARDILRRRGHTVAEASDVEEGRIALGVAVPDLVLLDIQIPGGGGEVLMRHIRADPRFAHLPVIAVTAYAMRGDRERFLEIGFDGYLSKPIDTRLFGAEVESYLEKGSPP